MTPLPINPTPQDYLDKIQEAFGIMLAAENTIKNCLDNYVHVTRHAERWHDGSEIPNHDDPDKMYLAIGLNGKPFLTHWWTEGIWLKSVVKWKYIDIPTNAPS